MNYSILNNISKGPYINVNNPQGKNINTTPNDFSKYIKSEILGDISEYEFVSNNEYITMLDNNYSPNNLDKSKKIRFL